MLKCQQLHALYANLCKSRHKSYQFLLHLIAPFPPVMLWKNGIKLAKCSINFTPKIQRKIALPGQSTWLKPLSPLFQGAGKSAGRSETEGQTQRNPRPSSPNSTAASAKQQQQRQPSSYILETRQRINRFLASASFSELCLSNRSRVYAGTWLQLHLIQRFHFYSNILGTAHLGAVWGPIHVTWGNGKLLCAG